MSIESFRRLEPFDNAELVQRSECFSKEFPKQHLSILNYLIANNTLLFYVEFKFPSNLFDNWPLVRVYNSGFLTPYTPHIHYPPRPKVDDYFYSFYPNHFDDVSF